jgi:2-keto-4-pentenoate hydratase/2-oxohepta-3-ene-1,7-dioic acid hydratase in catechol pathway
MKFASFRHAGTASWGVVGDGVMHDVGAALRDRFPDLKAAIAAGALAAARDAAAGAPAIPLEAIEWLPVIPNPDKILCVGLNYETHRKETGRAEVGHPTIFARYANSQTGHLKPMVRPRVSAEFDYEGELAVIIGRSCRHVPREEAFGVIAGYACYNDGSVRDFQRHTHQFTPGKNFPETGPFGPWMVTLDEVGPIGPQRIVTRVNGQVVQEATLGDMIFDVPTQIAYCSTFTRLEPGDVIATGTPGGVGSKRTPPLWLTPGDIVEVEIERIGLLRNPVADET